MGGEQGVETLFLVAMLHPPCKVMLLWHTTVSFATPAYFTAANTQKMFRKTNKRALPPPTPPTPLSTPSTHNTRKRTFRAFTGSRSPTATSLKDGNSLVNSFRQFIEWGRTGSTPRRGR